MGCAASQTVLAGNSFRSSISSNGSVKATIITESFRSSTLRYSQSPAQSLTNLKLREELVAAGSLPQYACDSMFDLHYVLDGRDSFKSIVDFVQSDPMLNMLLCWNDIKSFKAIDIDDVGEQQQFFAARQIFTNYLVLESPSFFNLKISKSVHVLAKLEKLIDEAQFDALPITLFNDIERCCFVTIFDELWPAYRKHLSANYLDSVKRDKRVGVDDFIYMEKKGEGGFGIVVHAIKLSTKKHYAMKIQSKVSLLRDYPDCPKRVTAERLAMTRCRHPFIMRLDYAFQTSDYVMIAMELCRSGTLSDFRKRCLRGQIREECVLFYAAEIATALQYMHRLRLMYRDLKPSNVLLFPNGHIKLVDLGGVTETKHMASSTRSNHSTTRSNHSNQSEDFPTISSNRVRSYSVVGTNGYMAPEMLAMVDEESELFDEGYSKSVDWWSLGILCIDLQMGYNPVKGVDVDRFLKWSGDYDRFINEVRTHPNVSNVAFQTYREFLDLDVNKRLGCGQDGFARLQNQELFKGIDWSRLMIGKMPPPDLPSILQTSTSVQYDSFDDMIKNCGGRKVKSAGEISGKLNFYFENWDYVAPESLKDELDFLSD